MPIRHRSHKIGDVATTDVMAIWQSCGFACEIIHHDYGDDLLVQTELNGQVDPHKIWVQVKSIENKGKLNMPDQITNYIERETVLKWIRSPDIVVFVVWSIIEKKGYWCVPALEFTEWDI